MLSLAFFSQGLIFLSSFPSSMVGWGYIIDNLNFLMISLSFFIGGLVLITCPPKQVFCIVSLFIIILIFFSSDSFLIFFMCYEFSLVPLLLILVIWGAQAERIQACQFMLLYTIIFSSPLLLFIVFLVTDSWSMGPLTLFLTYYHPNQLLNLYLLAFLVKAPIFFLHSWLPKAHVESPIEGSIILAGIMLKFGIYGLIRMMSIFNPPMMIKSWLFFFCLIGSILSCFLALSSDDMKMSVAYSSISHMNFLLSSIFTGKLIILKGSVMTMVSHGISSPLLFILVTHIYYLSHSRSILISKGFGSKIPPFLIISFLLWSMNFSVPPSLSFMSEVTMVSSILGFTKLMGWSLTLIAMYIVSMSFFSILNYGLIFHSPFKTLFKGVINSVQPMMLITWGLLTIFVLFFLTDLLWL